MDPGTHLEEKWPPQSAQKAEEQAELLGAGAAEIFGHLSLSPKVSASKSSYFHLKQEEIKDVVSKRFPLSGGAKDKLIALLYEKYNLRNFERVLSGMNGGANLWRFQLEPLSKFQEEDYYQNLKNPMDIVVHSNEGDKWTFQIDKNEENDQKIQKLTQLIITKKKKWVYPINDIYYGMKQPIMIKFLEPGQFMLDIFLIDLNKKTKLYALSYDTPIEYFKHLIMNRERIPSDGMRLIWCGKELLDGMTLCDYGIMNCATISLVLRLTGGGFALQFYLPSTFVSEGDQFSDNIIKLKVESEEEEIPIEEIISQIQLLTGLPKEILNIVLPNNFDEIGKIEIVNAFQVCFAGMSNIWVKKSSLKQVIDLVKLVSQQMQIQQSNLVFIYKGLQLQDSQLIGSTIKDGETVIVVTKAISERDKCYLMHDGQLSIQFMHSMHSKIQQMNHDTYFNELCEELKAFSLIQQLDIKIQELLEEINWVKLDQTCQSKQKLKILMNLTKIYTSNSCYSGINNSLAIGQYEKIKNYMVGILSQLDHGELQKQSFDTLYRGVPKSYANVEEYQIGRLHYWQALSSTSKSYTVALRFAQRDKTPADAVIFKITCSENKPITKYEVLPDWSFYPSEQEVLLMPNFCFVVEDIHINKLGVTIVEVKEVPHQNILQPRKLHMTRVIWIDRNFRNEQNQSYRQKFEQSFKAYGFKIVGTIEDALIQINKTVKAVLIISGQLGEYLIPRIHHRGNVVSICVFCMNVGYHKEWATSFSKIVKVTASFSECIQISKQMVQKALY
ncbi:hypothetical protein FGO68_gene10046 [Halteria grandinella]|uniref:Ubiquitin-like domain-containing protein n=1 Tax=Halteria grandinella TaxID=5974 RepID=A0A8J8NYT4_HALGN|nr:hypothetical protein FGO68_gene10046 [Halteria grandinella]